MDFLTDPRFIQGIAYVVVLLIGLYIDPDKKYQRVAYYILERVKEVTPDNVDEILTMIQRAMVEQGLNPNSRAGKKVLKEVKLSMIK